jgi:hypothetical protein
MTRGDDAAGPRPAALEALDSARQTLRAVARLVDSPDAEPSSGAALVWLGTVGLVHRLAELAADADDLPEPTA